MFYHNVDSDMDAPKYVLFLVSSNYLSACVNFYHNVDNDIDAPKYVFLRVS